jgi:pyruvate kinase
MFGVPPGKIESRASTSFATHEAFNRKHQQEEMSMKRSIMAMACALVAPLAFAQTTTTETTTSTHGTVTKYEHGKTIVVRTEKDENPISYALGKTVHYVNKAGRKIDEHLIKPGTRVIVYTAKGKLDAAERVVVDED